MTSPRWICSAVSFGDHSPVQPLTTTGSLRTGKLLPSNNRPAALDQPDQQYHHRYDEQYVDIPAQRVGAYNAQ